MATFKLTFGHGDMDMYYNSTPVILTYCIYVVIVGLLFMNLIIAIMSTTATEIMAEPWKSALWRVEWLEEATSLEYTICALGVVCRKCCSLRYYSHRMAEYIVKTQDGETKIYIKVFDCPSNA